MATAFPLPDASKVKTMLGLIFDGLDVKARSKMELSAASGCWFGLYVADDNKPVAACIADFALAAHSSAALSMLPPAMAKEAIKTKALSEAMTANLHEIMNICSRLLMSETSPHLRLHSLQPSSKMTAEITGVVGGAQGRLDFELSIPKYGAGALAFVST